MKQRVAVAAVLITFGAIGSAAAADLPLPQVYKAPPPAPWYDWTGFYGGANGGYSWGNSSTSVTTTGPIVVAPFSTSQTMDGWLGGGQVG